MSFATEMLRKLANEFFRKKPKDDTTQHEETKQETPDELVPINSEKSERSTEIIELPKKHNIDGTDVGIFASLPGELLISINYLFMFLKYNKIRASVIIDFERISSNSNYFSDEMIFSVLCFLDVVEICTLCQVSKRMQYYADHNHLWRSLVVRTFTSEVG